MKVLITGGAGFIGSHLVEHHLKKEDEVYVVDDLSSGIEANIAPFLSNKRFKFEKADITTWPNLTEAVAWADRIYHMAAVVGMYKVLKNPAAVLDINIAGCERVLKAAVATKQYPRIVIASSSSVYGEPTQKVLKEDSLLLIKPVAHSRWSYCISKLMNEVHSLAYSQQMNSNVTIARFFNTIGPRQRSRYGFVVPRFIQQAVEGQPITVFGDGTQTRSFCDVRDTIVALDLLAGNENSGGQIFNVGNDKEISMNELAELVKRIANSHSPIQHISYEEGYGEEFEDILSRRPSLKKLQGLTSFRNKWTLEDTIKDLVSRKYSQVKDRIEAQELIAG